MELPFDLLIYAQEKFKSSTWFLLAGGLLDTTENNLENALVYNFLLKRLCHHDHHVQSA